MPQGSTPLTDSCLRLTLFRKAIDKVFRFRGVPKLLWYSFSQSSSGLGKSHPAMVSSFPNSYPPIFLNQALRKIKLINKYGIGLENSLDMYTGLS